VKPTQATKVQRLILQKQGSKNNVFLFFSFFFFFFSFSCLLSLARLLITHMFFPTLPHLRSLHSSSNLRENTPNGRFCKGKSLSFPTKIQELEDLPPSISSNPSRQNKEAKFFRKIDEALNAITNLTIFEIS
jgi:hypothetical protein